MSEAGFCFLLSSVSYGKERDMADCISQDFEESSGVLDSIQLLDIFVPRDTSVEMPTDISIFGNKKLCPGLLLMAVKPVGDMALNRRECMNRLERIVSRHGKLLRHVGSDVSLLSYISKKEFDAFLSSVSNLESADSGDEGEVLGSFDYKEGDEVCIENGEFRGICGVIRHIDSDKGTGKRNVVLSVSFFGKEAKFTNIDSSLIRKISSDDKSELD